MQPSAASGESAVRNTQDVDILLRLEDLPAAEVALEAAGFTFRRKDQVHLLDMLDIGLIDATWLSKLPPVLAERLQRLIDDPNG